MKRRLWLYKKSVEHTSHAIGINGTYGMVNHSIAL